ncbi:LuxR C-terminal-related transcriptional regulator [Chloroflexota bacterium]
MDQLLTTKLHIPQLKTDLVSRPQLYARLEESLTHKLTLVSASTGFGKSTLVTDWLSETGRPAAWLSLDQGDNDPVRFWAYLIAAIQTIHHEIGEEAHQIVSTSRLRSTEHVAISLINDISQHSQDLIVVLDDYHLIEEGQVHESLSYLLEHQPPNLHIVLLTRVDPSISLARLRVHNQLIEIRAEDLQFSTEEAATLLNDKMGLSLKPEQIEVLNTRTESWVVGLQLAALSLRGQPSYDTFIEEFSGGHQFILDYLTEEVLITLPVVQREFLLRTSILDRFCGKLCQAVTDDPSSQQVLNEIRKNNLFLIPLDSSGRWFRYQHLFAEVLYALLERDHPGEVGALHLKAAAWFDREGYPGEAVDHALRSGDMVQAKEQILKHWMSVLHRGEVATVLRWLDALPESSDGADPYVPLARCWALFLSWQNSAIKPHLEEANNAFVRQVGDGSLCGAQQDLVAAQLAMMRSVIARERGEHTMSVAHAEEATHLLPREILEGFGTAWNMLAAARAGAGDFDGAIEAYKSGITLAYEEGNLVGAYGCAYGQAMYLLVQGRLNEAENLCRSAIDRAVSEGHGDFPASGWLYITLARIEMERNHLDEAGSILDTGLRIVRPGGFNEAMRSGRYLRAYLATTGGDLTTATNILEETARLVNATGEPYLTGELNWQWARLYLKANDLIAAREKLLILEEEITSTLHANLLLWRGWLLPRLLCAEKRFEETLLALNNSIDRARAGNSNGELIHLLALQAVALKALGDRIPSRAALHEGLALGAPEGYIMHWLDAGPEIEPLLREVKDDGDISQAFQPYLDSLLDACHGTFGDSTYPQESLPDPLTQREMEILHLIREGYSNPEIASQLVVTLNTIKKHTSNIYGKLGVKSRTQAIARSYELNLF